MIHAVSRRRFLSTKLSGVVAVALSPSLSAKKKDESWFRISLAQWSLHKSLGRGGNKVMDNLDFAAKAKKDFGIEAVEYVNQFFKDKAKDKKYLAEMKKRAKGSGVKGLLIMIDGEGNLGEPNENTRSKAIENHYKWGGLG